ncbi:MAG: tRNA (adenosine(37)-N6)-threonylcarbamoyltransferase complex dimerization subunit type 1 TsaB [Chloroflexi bacterium]|nr:tRNA (adenosine(37)-N6)-threonylcarbamoyltransferase complex dimerization subunit type 1 TsaB [Chloroflexota bacterium]
MLLAIDTATRNASIALYNAEGILAELTWRSRENHTVELMAQIVHLLDLLHAQKSDLQAIGVARGPGSFTGLRVGMSVAKGLAYGCSIPIMGVPTLDAVASAQAHQSKSIWAVLAAGRGRFSIAKYTSRDSTVNRSSEYALVDVNGLIDFVSRNGENTADAIFCGDIDSKLTTQLAQSFPQAVIASPAQNVRRAGYLAELAWARFQRGESDDVTSLAPMYMPHESVEGARA